MSLGQVGVYAAPESKVWADAKLTMIALNAKAVHTSKVTFFMFRLYQPAHRVQRTMLAREERGSGLSRQFLPSLRGVPSMVG